MRLPLPDIMARGLSGWSRPAQAAAWQLPLIGLLALEISMVLMLFWGGGLAMSTATRRWRRWYVQLPMIGGLVALAAMAVPVRSADFFIALMVAVLPLTWQLEEDAADERAPLSPAGLTPTIFLVGAVFLYQIQFFVLELGQLLQRHLVEFIFIPVFNRGLGATVIAVFLNLVLQQVLALLTRGVVNIFGSHGALGR